MSDETVKAIDSVTGNLLSEFIARRSELLCADCPPGPYELDLINLYEKAIDCLRLQNTRAPQQVDGISKAIERLTDVIESHADPESHNYNECGGPGKDCDWCVGAKEAIAALQQQTR